MSETPWDTKLKAFLKKTGSEFKRAGNEMKQEAERLIAEAKDPERAKKVKEGLTEVGTWAKKTAEELAGFVETGVKRAEGVIKEVVVRPNAAAPNPATAEQSAPPPAQAPTTVAPPSPAPAAAAEPERVVKKTVGRGTKKAAASKKPSAKKPLGRGKSKE